MGNAQAGSGSGFNKNWDASWTVRTHVNEIGWMAEFEIPLRSLRYGDRPQVWGMNFQRNIRRKREQVYWAPIERIYNLYRLSAAGELHGLELETPRNFKVTPYAVATASRDFTNAAETATDFDPDAGLDVKFGVTPSLNLDLTYNTDFAQVEVDEQVINLTRFNVRFPEKRPFFLENAGLFAAGKNGVDLFFSRRIGIDSSGVEVPILGGARLSGKVGAFNVGVLNMETDDIPGVTPKNNFTVARLSRELPNRTAFGGIVINREANGSNAASDDWNRTWGFDGKLGVGRYTDFRGFIARTETPGLPGNEAAYNFRGEYERVGGNFHVEYTQVDEDFNPEVGFLTRRAYRATDIGFFINKRFPRYRVAARAASTFIDTIPLGSRRVQGDRGDPHRQPCRFRERVVFQPRREPDDRGFESAVRDLAGRDHSAGDLQEYGDRLAIQKRFEPCAVVQLHADCRRILHR